MSQDRKIYCLDTNVLIQAWQKYYSPDICPDYWDTLNTLGLFGDIFIPEMVKEEITRTDDDLSDWVKKCSIPVMKIDEKVTQCWREILAKDPLHKFLINSEKQRSLADPWVIAHAMSESATVVTRENIVIQPNSKKIKIPNVCENMGVPWMNDFEFIREVGIQFSCNLRS